jgi:hypothetical protein
MGTIDQRNKDMTHLEKLIEQANAYEAKKAEMFKCEVVGELDFEDIFGDKEEDDDE